MALRELFATFGFDFDQATLDRMDRQVNAAIGHVQGLARRFDLTSAAARATAPSISGVTAAATKATVAVGALGARLEGIDGTSNGLRVGSQVLQHWAARAREAGIRAGGLRAAMAGVQSRVASAAAGDRELDESFKALGVDTRRLTESSRSASSVWQEMVGRLSKVRSEAERTRLAVRLLGTEGATIAARDLSQGLGTNRVVRRLAAPARRIEAVKSAPQRTSAAQPPVSTPGFVPRVTPRPVQAEARVLGGRASAAELQGLVAAMREASAAGSQVAGGLGRASTAAQSWAARARGAGVSAGEMRRALADLTGRVNAARAGDAELGGAFQALGVDLERASAKGRYASSVWQEMVGRLSKVRSEADRARLAVTVLGVAGAKVAAPTLGRGLAENRIQRRLDRPVQAPTARELSLWNRLRASVRRGADALDRLRRRSTGTAAGLRQVQTGAQQADRGVRGLGAAVRSVSSGSVLGGILQASFWTGLARSVARVGTAVARMGVRGAASFAGMIGEVSVWRDAVEKGLGMITGYGGTHGMQVGEKEFETSADAARRLGLNIRTAVDSYKQLRGVGFDRTQATDFLKLTADMKAGLGLTEETIGRVQLAFSQIKGAGKLQGDELRQLQETGLNIDRMWTNIAEKMGVTVEEAMALKEEGKVSADVALGAIKDTVLQTLGTTAPGEAAAKLATTTLRGALGKAKAEAQAWIMDLGKDLQPGLEQLLGKIGGTFARLAENGKLDKFLTNLKRMVIDTVDLIIIRWPEIERVIERTVDLAGNDLGTMVMHIDDVLSSMIDFADWVLTNWDEIKVAIVAGAVLMAAAIAAIGAASVINAISTVATAIGGIGASAVATEGVVAGAAVGIKASLGGIAIAAGAAAAALGSMLLAYDQFAKLQKETKADGGIVKSFQKAGGVKGFFEFLAGPSKKKDKPDKLPSKPGIDWTPRPAMPGMAPTLPWPAFQAAGGGGGGKAVTLNDHRTTEITVTAPTPAAAAKQVGQAVRRASTDDRAGTMAALGGASNG